jgi:hypothetical protein
LRIMAGSFAIRQSKTILGAIPAQRLQHFVIAV